MIDEDVREFLTSIHSAKVGFYYYKQLYEGNIEGFTIGNLTEKCKDYVEVSNFQVMRLLKYKELSLKKVKI